MVEILKTLRDTPLPSILVIGGLVFLLVPFLKKTGGAFEIETTNKGLAILLGIVLLTSGIGLHLLPIFLSNSNASISESTTPVATHSDETQLSIAPTTRPISTQSIVPANSIRTPIECAAYPVNPQDGVEVLLDESTWYVIQEFDNSQSPPIHRFWARKGPGSVIVILPRGMRAWACINEESALYTAMQSAIGFKSSHPDYKVYGPDGSEVK